MTQKQRQKMIALHQSLLQRATDALNNRYPELEDRDEVIDWLELEAIKRQSAESLKSVRTPDFSVDLSEWLTIKRYAEKYSLDTHVVTNWIRRGTIPADCVMQFVELNDIRLVKDRTYK